MKKLLILTACFSMAFAEDPMTAPPSEQQAKQEIENFLGIEEDDFLVEKDDPTEEMASQELQLNAPALHSIEAPRAAVLPSKKVELNTETPFIIKGPAAASAPHLQQASPTVAAARTVVEQSSLDPEDDVSALETEEKEVASAVKSYAIVIDLGQVFAGSPTIYTVLFCLSIASVALWVYALLKLRTEEVIPSSSIKKIREKLAHKQYDEVLTYCDKHPSILFKMVAAGIQSKDQGPLAMLDIMKAEGRRASNALWQKIALLNDIAIIAPMLGLLGTVLGMFYAFYDLNRSMESISALFDGLGISVGTTVGGLIVAILALIFHAITKYRLTRQLTLIENEAHTLAKLIENQG